jgi:hypothetical protein
MLALARCGLGPGRRAYRRRARELVINAGVRCSFLRLQRTALDRLLPARVPGRSAKAWILALTTLYALSSAAARWQTKGRASSTPG